MIKQFQRRLFSVVNKADLAVSCHPKVPKRGSFRVDLIQGQTYFWCTCGSSQSQPFCDGAHKGTDFRPLQFTWDKPDKLKAGLCGCKMNKDESGAMCDGSHKFIGDPQQLHLKPVGFFREPAFLEHMAAERAKD